jgi:WD40 repeat protein
LYESAGWKLVKHLKDAGFHAAFSPDGKRLAYTARVQPALDRNTAYDNLARVWDLDADKELFTVREKLNPCTGPHAFSPDGKLLYSKHCNDLIVREGDTGREVRRFTNALGNTMALSPDGKSIATDAGTAVKMLDAVTGEQRAWLPGAPSGIAHVAFDPTGRFVLGGGWFDAPALVWDVGQSPTGATLPGAPSDALSQSLSPDGTLVATRRRNARAEVGVLDPVIDIVDHATGALRHRFHSRGTGPFDGQHDFNQHLNSPMAFSRDNRFFVAALTTREVRVWDVATGKVVTTYRGHKQAVTDLAMTPDGKHVVTYGRDGTIRLWEAGTGKELASYSGQLRHTSRIAMSLDGKRLAVIGQDHQFFGCVRVWDLAGGGELDLRDDEQSSYTGAAFSPDGRHVAALLSNGRTRIYDAATGKKAIDLPGRQSYPRQVAWTPDGSRLAVAGYNTIELWDPATGQELLTLSNTPAPGVGYNGLFFSRDGHRLYFQNQGPIRCWDATPLPSKP